jgi:hypothetical protein
MTRAARILIRFRQRDKDKMAEDIRLLFARIPTSQKATANRFCIKKQLVSVDITANKAHSWTKLTA